MGHDRTTRIKEYLEAIAQNIEKPHLAEHVEIVLEDPHTKYPGVILRVPPARRPIIDRLVDRMENGDLRLIRRISQEAGLFKYEIYVQIPPHTPDDERNKTITEMLQMIPRRIKGFYATK